MNRLFNITMLMLLVVATLCFIGCNKADEPNNGGNGNNNGNNGETPETPTIVSTSEVQYDGTVYIEAVFEDESKLYFEILSPNELALVNGEFYYQDNPNSAYIYRGVIVIPENIKHLGTIYTVVSIEKKAFYHNDMVTSVFIPNSVTTINSYYTNSMNTFGAFQNCCNLEHIHMSENIQDIGANSFADCPCYEQSVTIDKQVEKIGANAFSSKAVIFNADSCIIAGGDNVTFNHSSAFPNMSSISFGNNVKVLPAYLYAMTSFTTIDIPSMNTIIPDYAFYGCTNLSNADLPNMVTTIGNSAFKGCTSLTDITLPSSIIQINNYAYYNYESDSTYTNITCMAVNPPILGNNVFGRRKIEVIYVPFSSIDAYKTADGWYRYADVIVGF